MSARIFLFLWSARPACALLLAFGFVMGCARTHVPAPGGVGTLEACRASLASRPRIQSFKGLAEVDIQQGSERATLRYAILFREPRELRIDILPPSLGYTLQSLVAKDGRAVFFDHSEHKAYQSKDTRTMVGRLFGRGLTEQELVSSLLGVPSFGSEHSGVRWDCDQQSALPLSLVLENVFNGVESMRFSYGGWNRRLAALPAEVSVDLAAKNTKLAFSFSMQTLNGPVSAEKFSLEIPPGYASEDLSVRTE